MAIHVKWTLFPCLLKHEFSTTIRILAFAFIGTFLFLHPGHTADIIGYLKKAWTRGPPTILRDVTTRKTAVLDNVSRVGKEVLFVLWSCFLFGGEKLGLDFKTLKLTTRWVLPVFNYSASANKTVASLLEKDGQWQWCHHSVPCCRFRSGSYIARVKQWIRLKLVLALENHLPCWET